MIPQNAQTTDGSFGDPGVRITEFVNAFPNSVVASICDKTYAASMTAIAMKLGALIKPNCLQGSFQKDSQGQPQCAVTNHLTDSSGNTTDIPIPNCQENGGAAPCWDLGQDTMACPGGGQALKVTQDANSMNAASLNSTVECSICFPGVNYPNGCT
jgi:hypothetical protein